MKEQSIDEVVKIKPEVIDRISEIDPSVTTSVDAAKFLKNEFDKECRARPENISFEIWVKSKSGTTKEGRDYYEFVGKIEHLDNQSLLTLIIPQISRWFQHKYVDNHDAELVVEQWGNVPSHLFMTDMEDEKLETVHREEILVI